MTLDQLAIQVGKHLKDRRRAAFPRDTQKDMAARLGVGVATYSRMERGDASVSFRHYLNAAQLLGCEAHTSELFTHPDRQEGLIRQLLTEGSHGR